MSIVKTTRLSSLLPVYLADEVKKVSKEKNITQSSIVKKALELWFNNKLDNDTRQLAKINFDDLPSKEDWALIQSEVK